MIKAVFPERTTPSTTGTWILPGVQPDCLIYWLWLYMTVL